MPLDASFAGHSYPPTVPYRVGREKIREFCEAIGASDEAYLDPEAARKLGYPDVIAPPTFAIVLTNSGVRLLVEDPDLGLDFSRVVHGDQRFAYHRPIHAGDVLICVSKIEEITSRGGHDFLVVRSDVTAEDGELVVTGWSRLVVRGE
jgi:acyl dehydratase